jgi:hypothetical protein
MPKNNENVPTSHHLFYNTWSANETANDCRKEFITFFN